MQPFWARSANKLGSGRQRQLLPQPCSVPSCWNSAFQGAQGSPGCQGGWWHCPISQISLGQRFLSTSFLLTPIHSLPSQSVLPPQAAGQKKNICIFHQPRTGWQKEPPRQVWSSLLFSSYYHSLQSLQPTFSGSPPPWLLSSLGFKHFIIQSDTDKAPPVCNQD